MASASKQFIVVVSVVGKCKAIVPYTAVECSTDDTFIDLFKTLQNKPSVRTTIAHINQEHFKTSLFNVPA